MKIVILDGYGLNPGDMSWQAFEELGEVTVYDRTNNSNPNEVIERIGDAEVALTNKTIFTAEIMAACPNLRYIGVLATGYNVVDVVAANQHKIVVTNIPSYGTDAVAQFTFALLLEIASQVGEHNASVHQGDWQTNPDFTYWKTPLMELSGKTLGLVGYGRIAQAVAKIALAFNMQVIFANHREKEHPQEITQVSLTELYQQADIISLHVPQFPETEQMINKEALDQMKPGVILLNTSRGGLIDETDVAQALARGQLGAYAADVVTKEPIAASNPLLTSPNTYLTPHIAWAPTQTRERLMEIAVNNLAGFSKGQVINQVN
ncbi:MAG: D-2-hydroxyacid dehydrogenase [Enterococcus sp.]